jgi:uncharacterized protein YecT (DUF1311 family)
MRIILLVLCFVSPCLFAADQPSVVETAKRFNLDLAAVRKHHETGCDTGFPREIYICGAHHFVAADMELNKAYRALLAEIRTKAGQEKLKVAQRAWVELRDKVYAFEADGYSDEPDFEATILSCKGKYTEERTKQLSEYANCGGMRGCPGIAH